MKKRRSRPPSKEQESPQLALIRRLLGLMTEAQIDELELADERAGLKVRLVRGGRAAPGGGPLLQLVQGRASAPAAEEAGVAPVGGGGEGAGEAAAGTPFPSPLVGTFYRSPSPEAEAFVAVGSKVEEDTVLCIIEAMKVMNEIRAETRGEIAAVLVENGEPVEFGQPLFLIRPT